MLNSINSSFSADTKGNVMIISAPVQAMISSLALVAMTSFTVKKAMIPLSGLRVLKPSMVAPAQIQ